MLIAIDLTSVSYHLTGIERYAICVTDRMIEADKRNDYILFFRNEEYEIFKDKIDGKRIKSVVLYGDRKLFFLQITLARALKKSNADKYLFFAYPSPICMKEKGIINTIHDMGAWDSPAEAQTINKYYFRISYRHAARISEKIITVSNFSKDRIHKILNVPKNKIEVIYSAVYGGLIRNGKTSFELIKKEYNLPDRYILTLSTLEPRKNIKLLLDSYYNIAEKVDYDLVLVGRKGWKMDDVINQYNIKDRIHITGFVKDEHLSGVYRNALCFVFPSLYEGFGLPPVEALSFHVPVISSDAASLPEILQNQAIYFKNNNAEDLSQLLLSLNTYVNEMPHELNEFQEKEYCFDISAKKVLNILHDQER